MHDDPNAPNPSPSPEKHPGLPMNTTPSQTLSFTAIMPSLNEENNVVEAITSTLEAMDAFGIDGRVMVIDDGSTDETGERVSEYMSRDPRVRMIRHDTPQGIGSSFWEGVEQADTEGVVIIPGDNEIDPVEIFRYAVLMNHVDIVIPFLYDRNTRSMFRNILSLIYRKIINMTFRTNFNYTNGAVLYRREVLLTLNYRSRSFFFQTDILIRLVRDGYLFAEVPYKIRRREHGRSKAVNFPSLFAVMRGYFLLIKAIYFKAKYKSQPKEISPGSMTAARRQGYNEKGE